MCENKLLKDLKVIDLKNEIFKFNIETKNLKKDELIELLRNLRKANIVVKNFYPDTLVLKDNSDKNNTDLSKNEVYNTKQIEELTNLNQKLNEQIKDLNLHVANLQEKVNHLNYLKDSCVPEKVDDHIKSIQQSSFLILADSHGRDINKILLNNFKLNFKSESVFKPNATFTQVTNNISSLTSKFCKKDKVLILAGTNDFNHGRYPSFKCIVDVLNQCKNTNVTLGLVPYRYDQRHYNKFIRKYNLKLIEVVKKYNYQKDSEVDILDTNNGIGRECYTRHGLHFGSRGKNKLASMIFNHLTYGSKLNLNRNLINLTGGTVTHQEPLLPSVEKSYSTVLTNKLDISQDDDAESMISALDSITDNELSLSDDEDGCNTTRVKTNNLENNVVSEKSSDFLEV